MPDQFLVPKTGNMPPFDGDDIAEDFEAVNSVARTADPLPVMSEDFQSPSRTAGSTMLRNRPTALVRLLKTAVLGIVFAAVWLIGFDGGDGQAPVLPDTQTAFSLDLEVMDSTDHGVVYVVEQRARPNYRIFSFDPATGAAETVFTVPEDAIIYGIALSPDASTLAVTYATDFANGGSGLWLLDLAVSESPTPEITEVSAVVPDVYLADPAWSASGETVLATQIDRRGEDEQLSMVKVSLDDGAITTLLDNAIAPAVVGDDIYHLVVGEDSARSSIGMVEADGGTQVTAFGDSTQDLDHLTSEPNGSALHVAVLDNPDEPVVSVGGRADAHGSHDVPSTWWTVTLTGTDEGVDATGIAPIIVYDAAATDQSIVYATLEGLSIATPAQDAQRIDLIRSRAIRFVAA